MALQWNSGPFRGSYTTNTFSTGRAQPIQPPSLGNQYGQPGWGVMPSPLPQLPGAPEMPQPAPSPQKPSYQRPANGTIRTDPSSGKMVTYKDGQWTWQPNPISGPQPYDTSRFGDAPPQGQQPIPPSSQKTTWTIPQQHAAEFLKYQQSRGPRDMMYDPERDRREYEQWAENTGRAAPGSSYYPGGPSVPERPGQARPIQQPSQGTPYEPSAPPRHQAYDLSRTNPYMPPDSTPWYPQLTGEERRQALIAPRNYSPEEAAQRQRMADLQKEADKLTAPKAPAYDLSDYYRKLPPGMTIKRPPQRS